MPQAMREDFGGTPSSAPPPSQGRRAGGRQHWGTRPSLVPGHCAGLTPGPWRRNGAGSGGPPPHPGNHRHSLRGLGESPAASRRSAGWTHSVGRPPRGPRDSRACAGPSCWAATPSRGPRGGPVAHEFGGAHVSPWRSPSPGCPLDAKLPPRRAVAPTTGLAPGLGPQERTGGQPHAGGPGMSELRPRALPPPGVVRGSRAPGSKRLPGPVPRSEASRPPGPARLSCWGLAPTPARACEVPASPSATIGARGRGGGHLFKSVRR